MNNDTETLLIWGGVALVAWYFINKVTPTLPSFTNIGDAIGSGLYDLFNPASLTGNQYAVITFPDGSSHAIDAALINSSGVFTVPSYAVDNGVTVSAAVEQAYGGQEYQVAQAVSGGAYTCYPVSATSSTISTVENALNQVASFLP